MGKETSLTIQCPDGPSARDIPNRDEKNKELGITASGSVPSIRPLGMSHLKCFLLLNRVRHFLKSSFFWTREQSQGVQMS